MRKYSLNQMPMVLASFGLFAGLNAHDKKIEDRIPQNCAGLCADRPGFDCDREFDIQAAAIYEQIRVQGGEVGFVTQSVTQAIYPVEGVGIEQPEDFAWGFKVGGGYSGWNDNWRSAVKYTYYRASTNTDDQISYGSGYVPSVYANENTNTQYQGIHTSFANLQMGNETVFNNLVFSLGRPSIITDRVSLDTYCAIDATFLTRRQLQVYTNDIVSGTTVLATGAQRYPAASGGYFKNYQKISWWGVGPAVGLNGDYFIGKGVSIYGNARGALEYGLSSVRTSTLSSPKVGPSSAEAVVQNSLYQFSPSLNYELGLDWRYIFEEDQVRLSFQIAYENAYYFTVMRTAVPSSLTSSATGAGLGLQGVVLQGMLEF